MDGNKSCLKEILTEIRYQIIATLRYQGTETKILFPEYYADAVENTPARIVETHYYGSGGEYRECFYQQELIMENTTSCLHFLKQKIRKRRFSCGADASAISVEAGRCGKAAL